MSAVSNYIIGVYEDDEVALNAAKYVKTNGVKIHEIYSPFPIHGIDDVLGIKRSRLDIAAFLFGVTGTCLAVSMQSFMLGVDWPMIIGGKPYIAPPDLVPVAFELTVLCAALGMVFTFLLASGLGPGSQKLVLDPRFSDDKFILAVDLDRNKQSAEAIADILKKTGASEISIKEVTES